MKVGKKSSKNKLFKRYWSDLNTLKVNCTNIMIRTTSAFTLSTPQNVLNNSEFFHIIKRYMYGIST